MEGCHESDGLPTLNSARKQQINALTQQQVQELTAQHRTTAEQNRTKPKTSYNQIHNILTHTYSQLQAITTNTYTQSANTTESQPAQKGQFITVLPPYDGRRGSKRAAWLSSPGSTGRAPRDSPSALVFAVPLRRTIEKPYGCTTRAHRMSLGFVFFILCSQARG